MYQTANLNGVYFILGVVFSWLVYFVLPGVKKKFQKPKKFRYDGIKSMTYSTEFDYDLEGELSSRKF